MGCNDYTPLSAEGYARVAEAERKRKADRQVRVNSYVNQLCHFLDEGLVASISEIVPILTEINMPNRNELKKAVQNIVHSGQYELTPNLRIRYMGNHYEPPESAHEPISDRLARVNDYARQMVILLDSGLVASMPELTEIILTKNLPDPGEIKEAAQKVAFTGGYERTANSRLMSRK